MKQKNRYCLIALLILLTLQTFAQSGLLISSGSNFFITNGNIISIDSLALIPSANYNITGSNSETRDATAVPSPSAAYIQRVFHFSSLLPAYSGTITIYYRDAELNGLDENSLNLNAYNGTTWNIYAATIRDATNNFITTAGLNNISMNELTASPAAPLPITLSDFMAQSYRCTANLAWITATEQNSKNFEVQYSTDGVTFTTIAVVPAGGNSSTEKHYSYSSNLSNQNNYFRLRMVNIDGSSKFSQVLSVVGNCANNNIILFPNPAKNSITVNGLSGSSQLKLLNNQGKAITTITTTNYSEKLNIAHLPAGAYTLEIVQNNKVIVNIKLIKE